MGTRQVSDNRDDGMVIGQDAGDLVGFHGATPVAQAAVATSVTATATTAMSTTLTISAANTSKVFGFSSSTVAKEIVKCVKEMQVDLAATVTLANSMRTLLVNKGLMASS